MKFLEAIKLLLGLFPLLIQVIQSVEAALPVGTAGATKLEMVKNVIAAAYTSGSDAVVSFEQVWPPIQKSIDGIVTAFNATGLFKKSGATAPQAQTGNVPQ